MDLYIEIAGGCCMAIYYTGDKYSDIKTTIVDFDDNQNTTNLPPQEERTYLY